MLQNTFNVALVLPARNTVNTPGQFVALANGVVA
jgi:hypothetical protein